MIYKAPACSERQVRSIFIGGGTPSIMTSGQIHRIMETIYNNYDIAAGAEISMECNPGTTGRNSFREIRDSGINRLSFGLQSMNDGELRTLGRIHSPSEFLESYEAARGAGIENINVDLMSGLPGQTPGSWRDTLEAVADLEPEHISAYSLIIEEGTPFYDIYGGSSINVNKSEMKAQKDPGAEETGKKEKDSGIRKQTQADFPPLPDEDTERSMYHETGRILGERGYTHYEVSNYAKPGRECIHNMTYWYRGDYLGFGLGAASLMDGRRFSNTRDMSIYMKKDIQKTWLLQGGPQIICGAGGNKTYGREKTAVVPDSDEAPELLSVQDKMEETMFLGLRCCTGVGKRKFRVEFGRDIYEVYGDIIKKYTELGMIIDDGNRIKLSERGIDVSNWILSDFLF